MKNVLYGLGFGAGLMYVLDPEAGPERRRRIRTRVQSALRRTGEAESAVEPTVDIVQGKARRATLDVQDAAQRRSLEEHPQHRDSEDGLGSTPSSKRHAAGRALAATTGGALAYYGLRRWLAKTGQGGDMPRDRRSRPPGLQNHEPQPVPTGPERRGIAV